LKVLGFHAHDQVVFGNAGIVDGDWIIRVVEGLILVLVTGVLGLFMG